MEKFQVSLPPFEAQGQRENPSGEANSKPKGRFITFMKVLTIVLIGGLIIFGFIFLDVKYDNLRGEVKATSGLNHCDKMFASKYALIASQMNESLRRFTNERVNKVQEAIREMKSHSNNTQVTPGDWVPNFKQIQSHLNSLLFIVGNLSRDVSRVNVSSDSKLSHLSDNLNAMKNDIILLQNELTQLNQSLHSDIISFVTSAVNDLRQDLNKTITKIGRLSERTDAEIDDIVKLLSQQNETLHFKIAYHSDALLSEVKGVEQNLQKLSKSHNETAKALEKISNELNETRVNLQQSILNEISRASDSLHKELRVVKDSVGSVRASIKKINSSVKRNKNDLQTNINNILDKQKKMNKDFAETKAKFQEEHRKYDASSAGRATQMGNMRRRIEDLEEKRRLDSSKISLLNKEIAGLKRTVTAKENGANSVLKTDVKLFLFVSVILAYVL